MAIGVVKQSVKLMLAKASAATDGAGKAEAVIKIPGTFSVDAKGDLASDRTINGGWGYFANQADGDYVHAQVQDDDNLLGYGAGFIVDTFHDKDVTTANQGWYFPRQQVLELRPLVSDDPTSLPNGLYLHIIAQKANIATSDTFYVNVHWGKRIR
jgi:hypothetical protein